MSKRSNETRAKLISKFLRFEISAEFFLIFDDLDKIILLNSMLKNRGERHLVVEDAEKYKLFLVRFYFCERFDKIYQTWLASGQKSYLKPSIDHIIPKSKDGTNRLENLRAVSWIQNRAKGNLDIEIWNKILENPSEFFY